MPEPLATLHVFPGFAVGGAQVRAARLIAALGAEFEHAVVSLSGDRAGYELLERPERLEWVEPPPRAGTLRTVRALRTILRARRPDLVLTYNWGAIDAVLACRLSRRRALVHHEDGFGPDEVRARRPRRNLGRRLVLPGAHRVVVPSRVLERIALEEWRLPRGLVELVPNGVDLAHFAPPPAGDGRGARVRAELGIPPGAFAFVTVGGLRPEKRPDRLLAAAALLPGAHAILVGAGGERERLARRAGEPDLAGRVHLVGAREDPVPHLLAADAFALPSDTEQMPIAMVEAMALGLPVAATDVGDVRAILPDEQARFVVPPEGAADLAAALRALAADPELRAALGRANRARVERRYGADAMVARYRELYRAAAAARPAGRRG